MRCFFLAAAFIACVAGLATEDENAKATRKHHSKHHGKHHGKHHHHHHHHGKHHKHVADAQPEGLANVVKTSDVAAFGAEFKKAFEPKEVKAVEKKAETKATKQVAPVSHVISKAKAVEKKAVATKAKAKEEVKEDAIVKQMKVLEAKLQKKKVEKQGQIFVNGPLPADFKERFSQAVSIALGKPVKVTQTKASEGGIVAVSFVGAPHVVDQVTTEVSDPDSKLATGNLHSFLVSKGDDNEEAAPAAPAAPEEVATPVEEKGIDIDTAMPYGDLEPFGREDTAQELTEDSISQSNSMVDQLERAEVAEEKRAVFRALTRLRGAAITSFDGVARSQTGNIDEYNKIHKWRSSHPLHHLADEESDISKWAFPDNADF